MSRCIYCPKDLEDEEEEHIFLESLGGKKGSSEIVCTQCNHYFSQAIDKYLPEALAAVRILLGVNPPTAVKLPEKDGEAEYLFYRDRRRKKLLKVTKQLVEKEPGLREKFLVEIEGDPQQVADMIQGLIAKYGEGNFETGPINWFTSRPAVVDSIDIGGHEQYRSVAKIAFNYLAYLATRGVYSLDVATHPQFDSIRAYIRHGDNREIEFPCHLDNRYSFELPDVEFSQLVKDAVFNRVTIYCSAVHSNIIAYVTILGSLTFSALLSFTYTGEKRAFRFTEYPLKRGPGQYEELTRFPDTPTTEQLLQWPSYEESYGIIRDLLSHLLGLAMQKDEDDFLDCCIRETFEKLGLEELTPDRPREVEQFAKLLVEKLWRGQLGPTEQSLRRFNSIHDLLEFFKDHS